MLPPETNDRDDDRPNHQREFIQKKSYRAMKFFESEQRVLFVLLLTWLAWPIERLQAELEWLDEVNELFPWKVTLSQQMRPNI